MSDAAHTMMQSTTTDEAVRTALQPQPAIRRAQWITAKLVGYELRDVVRSRWILLYGLFFFAAAQTLIWFGGGTQSALIGLTHIVLLVVPLVGIVFGTMYLYSARDFIEMLLAQPVRRSQLYAGLYAGLALPLAAAFAVGIALPFLLNGIAADVVGAFWSILGAGMLLTLVFVGFAFPIALRHDERVRGLGVALGIWLLTCMIYDGLVLLVVTAAAAYPLEMPAIAMMLLNPVDLARTILLMQFDLAALMGYTGAVFDRFFGSALGTAVALGMLTVWAAVPFMVGMVRFRKKDF